MVIFLGSEACHHHQQGRLRIDWPEPDLRGLGNPVENYIEGPRRAYSEFLGVLSLKLAYVDDPRAQPGGQ